MLVNRCPDCAAADICGAPVGANRCRLAPHDSGRHDVAPDHIADAYRPDDEPRLMTRLLEPAWLGSVTWACPVTDRVCSCRPGERCSPDVHRARDPLAE